MQAAEAGYFRSGGRGLCGEPASAGHLRSPLRDGRLVDQTGPDLRPAHRHLAAVRLHRYGRKHRVRSVRSDVNSIAAPSFCCLL